jgi:hypothetical protein
MTAQTQTPSLWQKIGRAIFGGTRTEGEKKKKKQKTAYENIRGRREQMKDIMKDI